MTLQALPCRPAAGARQHLGRGGTPEKAPLADKPHLQAGAVNKQRLMKQHHGQIIPEALPHNSAASSCKMWVASPSTNGSTRSPTSWLTPLGRRDKASLGFKRSALQSVP